MNGPVLIISRCKDENSFHFKGYYQGKKIEMISCPGHGLEVGKDFLIWARVEKTEKKKLVIKIITSKEVA